MNPSRKLIVGVTCGVRVEEIEDPLMQEIRYLDKVVDALSGQGDGQDPPHAATRYAVADWARVGHAPE